MVDAKKKMKIRGGYCSHVIILFKIAYGLIKGHQQEQAWDHKLNQQKRILQEQLESLKTVNEVALGLVEDQTKITIS